MTAGTVARIRVDAGTGYDVVVGAELDLGRELHALLPGSRRVAVVAAAGPAGVSAVVGEVVAGLSAGGLEPSLVAVPAGEHAKDLAVAASCWDALGRLGIDRADAVVTVGGGATTDVGGFVAATWLRGVRVVHVPTTLLAMVDAAIGGKTGVNTTAGKNLVGAFHQPAGVLCELNSLRTLPGPEIASGMAEIIKAGFIRDPGILDLLAGVGPVTAAGAEFREMVERAVRVKAAVVGADAREAGPREALNYGHTLAHAIEKVEGYRWRHGAAVSVGLCFAAELGRLAGRLDEATAARHRSTLGAAGLPTSYDGSRWPQLRAAMTGDKKSRGGRLRFVVLDGLGRPGVLEDPDPALLERAFAAVATPEGSVP